LGWDIAFPPAGLESAVNLLAKESEMKVLLHAEFPNEEFNAAVRDGSLEKKMKQILEAAKPEAVYFTDSGGRRSAILIVEMTDASQMTTYAEPWFLTFNADVEMHIVMTPEDLAKGDLGALGKKWG
jgi:hypothetical protein